MRIGGIRRKRELIGEIKDREVERSEVMKIKKMKKIENVGFIVIGNGKDLGKKRIKC